MIGTDWIEGRAGRDARLRRIADCLSIAVANLIQDRLRFAIAVAGTAVPILLVLLQMALLQGVRTEVTRLYNDFDFDIALLPVTYEYMFSSGVFDSVRLAQAQAVDGVADTFALNVDGGAWTGPAEKRSPLIVIGIDDKPRFIRDAEIRAGLSALGTGADVLVDRYSSANFGPLAPGTNAFLDDHPVTIAGHFSLGMFFYADGAAIMRNVFLPPLSGASSRDVHIGLIALDPGADPVRTKAALIEALPPDVQVLTRNELIDGEQDFFLSTKPLGIMVTVGMAVAFLAGIVVLWQDQRICHPQRHGFRRALRAGCGFLRDLPSGHGRIPARDAGGRADPAVAGMGHAPAGGRHARIDPEGAGHRAGDVRILCRVCRPPHRPRPARQPVLTGHRKYRCTDPAAGDIPIPDAHAKIAGREAGS